MFYAQIALVFQSLTLVPGDMHVNTVRPVIRVYATDSTLEYDTRTRALEYDTHVPIMDYDARAHSYTHQFGR